MDADASTLLLLGAWIIGAPPDVDVDVERLRSHVETLASFGTRVEGTHGARAATDYVVDTLAEFEVVASRRPFLAEQVFAPGVYVGCTNVSARFGRPGAPRLYLIAHLDSRGAQNIKDAAATSWQWDQSLAPGADDNASGAAALIEIARVLAASPSIERAEIELVWSAAEEMAIVDFYGFMINIGAELVADDAAQAPGGVLGAIAVDMLFRGSSFRVYSDGRHASSSLAEAILLASASSAPASYVREIVDPSFAWSDHGSFWARGLGGVLFIEDDFHHERYHRPTDAYDLSFYSVEQLFTGTRIMLETILLLAR